MSFIQEGIKFTKGLTQMRWFLLYSDLISHTHVNRHKHKHRQTHIGHTGSDRLINTYQYILTPPAMCIKQLPVLHSVNNLLMQTFTLTRLTMSLLFKNYSTCRTHISAD